MRYFPIVFLLLLASLTSLPAQTAALDSAMSLMINDRFVQAAALLEQTVRHEPQNVSAWRLLGQARQALQQYDLAADAFAKAANLRPADRAVRLNWADAFIQLGRYDRAEALLKQSGKQDSSDGPVNIRLAKVYFEQNRFGAALKYYHRLKKQFPDNAYFYRRAAVCASKLNRLKAAERDFRKTLQLNPADFKASVLFYNLLKKQQRWPEALNILNLALTNHPKASQLYLARGDTYLSMEKYLPARQDYSKALTLGDSTAYVFKKIGVAYYYLNDFAAALYALQKSVQKKADDPLVFYFLGLAQKSLHMTDKAIASFRKALALALPTYLPDLYFNLADSYTSRKDYPTALSYYKQVLQVAPERKIVLFYMATIYDKYYKDAQVPLRYYQQFLQQADEKIPKRYKKYALERMKALREKLHFQKGKLKK